MTDRPSYASLAAETLADIDTMIRLRSSRSPAIVQMNRWREVLEAERARADASEAQNREKDAEIARLKRLVEIRDRHANTSSRFWVRAGKAALAGDPRELRNRIDLAEAPPVDLVLSEEAEAYVQALNKQNALLREHSAILTYLLNQCAESYGNGSPAEPSPAEHNITWQWQQSTPGIPRLYDVLREDARLYYQRYVNEMDPGDEPTEWDRECLAHCAALSPEEHHEEPGQKPGQQSRTKSTPADEQSGETSPGPEESRS